MVVKLLRDEDTLISIENLTKNFKVKGGGYLTAVDNVSIKIRKGETFGLVGESGSGKSTLGRLCLKFEEPSSGKVIYNGEDIVNIKGRKLKSFRKSAQMIFQDSFNSLNPKMKVKNIIGEGIKIHNLCNSDKEVKEKVFELLEVVGLDKEHSNRYVHEFSGGQQQRIGIARALSVNPDFIVCDEPISALDVSIQAQIVNLLVDLQKEHGLTYLFIAHDLSMVKYISTRIAVMYLGSIVELSTSENLYNGALHPYTKTLLSAIPIPDPIIEKNRKRILLDGEMPSPLDNIDGCKFSGRCPEAKDICFKKIPKFKKVDNDHYVACHNI